MTTNAPAAPAESAEPAAPTEPVENASASEAAKPEYTPPATQAELDKIISDRLKRAKPADYDELKAKADKFTEIENANKTDLEKEQQRAAEAEARLAELELRATRAEVAAEKGVPADLLTGATRDEIEAAADRLIEFRGAKTPVGVHLPNQDKTPQGQKSDLGETARKLFGGQ